jgi:molecular chaperone IbpA
MRTSFDLTPLLRSSVGFDRFNRVFETLARSQDTAPSYPPYNIEKSGEDQYRVTMAVAGFSDDDIDVTVKENTLLVTGRALPETEGARYLHRGIAGRAFERRFELADTIQVVGAKLEHGLLHIDLVREVPEALKPRTIAIESKAA